MSVVTGARHMLAKHIHIKKATQGIYSRATVVEALMGTQ